MEFTELELNLIWQAVYNERAETANTTRTGNGIELDQRYNDYSAILKKVKDKMKNA